MKVLLYFMRILLFGGNGKVGENVVTVALKQRDEIILFVRSATRIPDEVLTNNKIEIVLGDYACEQDIRNIIMSSKPDLLLLPLELKNEELDHSMKQLFGLLYLPYLPLIY